jgi:uncharacterized protein (DUF305 family)
VNYKLPLIAVAVLAMAGCGSADEASTTAESAAVTAAADTTRTTAEEVTTTTGESVDAVFNDADVAFAQNMIPHHDQAIAMADLALDPVSGAGPEVIGLAERIKAAQGPEVEMMNGWLDRWGQPMSTDMGQEDHNMGSMDGMAGLMSAGEMAALADATGPDFDRMWLEQMVKHHQGAIAMAEQAKVDASNPELIGLADAVISAQQTEIEEMNLLLAG